ncbi:MAG: transaldolase family protein [Patescibacteria group bacterium]|nr:transaldolase family protein [Patescibacteria group bacterium]
MYTKIFLDSGDPQETKETLKVLGQLDGQTTNPSLIAKNPQAQGKKFSTKEVYAFYKKVVEEISGLIPQGSVSVEVYADKTTSVATMVNQAQEMNAWIPNAHIKLPITRNGLETAGILVKEGIKVNMTLCFTQEQAAAVYEVTKGAKKGDVFISPFIGRLDDKGINGLDLIKNCLEMFKTSDGHVEVLAASTRNLYHHLACLEMGVDIVTSPLTILKQWSEIKSLAYEKIDLDKSWTEYNLNHPLTDTGIDKFCTDWNQMIEQVEPEGLEPSTSSM